jgi:hypothetical protein
LRIAYLVVPDYKSRTLQVHMKSRANRSNVNEIKPRSQSLADKQNHGSSALPFKDNRPEALAQQKRQAIANNGAHMRRLIQFKDRVNQNLSAPFAAQMQAPPAGAAPLQLLMNRATFEGRRTAVGEQNARLGVIADHLDTFHGLTDENDQNYQGRLRALRLLDTVSYEWLDTFVQAKVEDTTNGPLIRRILQESATAHREIITAVKENANLLPIDTHGMAVGPQRAMLELWRSIVAGEGNIRIIEREDAAGFEDRMLAAIAKIIQGPNGRQLIQQLNTGGEDEAKRITLSSNFRAELEETSKDESAQSEAIPISSLAEGAEDYEFNPASEAELAEMGEEDVTNYEGDNDDMQALRAFTTTLETPFFSYRDTVYKVGTKTGSYVRIHGKGDKILTGERNQEVITPEFITVAHELGHAQEFLAGVGTSAVDLSTFGVQANTPDARLWRRSGEFANIKGSENAVRADHRISNRKYHSGSVDDVRKQIRYKAFQDAMANIFDPLADWTASKVVRHPVVEALMNFDLQPPADFNWADNGTVATLMQRVAAAQPIAQALDAIGRNRKNPDILYDNASGRLKKNLDKDHDFQYYYRMFLGRIRLATAAAISNRTDAIIDFAYERYISMELKTARDTQFLGLDENDE